MTIAAENLFVGLGGVARNGCAAVCRNQQVLGICEQERITRVRAAGFNATGLPDEALDEILERNRATRAEIASYAVAELVSSSNGLKPISLDHHFAHACSAFLTSPFNSATILVCDHEQPEVSLWRGDAGGIVRIPLPWLGPGFATVYSQCARILGVGAGGQEQRMEALARYDSRQDDVRAARLFRLTDDHLELARDWAADVETWLGTDASREHLCHVMAALQSRITDLVVEFLARVRQQTPLNRALCVAGSLFYNSHINASVKSSHIFEEVHVPVDPGNAGLAIGAALHLSGNARQYLSPFLGPSYSPEETKATLDNCKLGYEWLSEGDAVSMAVENLQKGRLVAWYEGAMESGPRALGARSILANPFAPYVLENLNHFLKRRAPWRGYALSAMDTVVGDYFDGPITSPFMECDFVPKDPARFKHILPGPRAAVRIQTVGREAPSRFRGLLQAFGEATGMPILVNTSFNGFREPIVCTPRDAVRVFFGTGTDLLLLDRFAISK